jgi:ATP synthase F0 subunit b
MSRIPRVMSFATWLALANLALANVALAAPAHGEAAPAAHGAAPAAGHEAAHGGGIEWISPVFGNTGKTGLLWILINFAVLMWLLEKLLFSKLRASTARKSDEIKSQLDRASAAREQAEGVMKDVRARLSRMDGEVEEILAEARSRAAADRSRIIAAAEAEAERIRQSAIAAAEREGELRRRQLEKEIVDRAVARAEVLLRERIGAADQVRMVDDYIRQAASAPLGAAEGGPS